MGFFGFLKKEKGISFETSSEETARVGINEISTWFERAFKDMVEKSRSRGSDLHQGVTDSFLEVRNAFVALESARFPGTERIHAAANMIKDSFVKKSYPVISNFERVSKETEMSFSGLSTFSEEAKKTLDTLKSTTPKQTILLTRYFKKESDPVITRIKETEEKLKALNSWLENEKILRIEERIRNGVKDQLSYLRELDSLEKKREGLREEINTLKEKKQEKESEFLDLLKSREWKEFNEMGKDIKGVNSEIAGIEHGITNELSPMKRPLKKMEYVLKKQDIMFNHKGFLRGFMQDPFESIKTKNGEDSLRRFLFTLSRMAHDRKIDLKDTEMERLDSLLEKMVREIPEMKKKYSELEERKERMEKTLEELSRTEERKERLEAEVESLSKEIASMEKEAADVARSQERIRERIKGDKRELEKLVLLETGRELEIIG